MANRFAHLIPQQQATEGQTKPGNRFAHLIPKKDKVAAKPLTYDSQSVNRDGKGDMGLAPGEVAASTYAQDIARSAASGLRSGAEMLAGTVGDVQEMSGNAAGWLANKAGLSPQAQDVAKKAGRLIAFPGVVPFAPTTEQVRGVTNSVAGEAYQPQTTPGEFARTIGEFAPNVAVGGPGGIGRKAAMTVVPAVISEGAGQLAEGSQYEPVARVGGAVVGALASGGKGNATKQLAKKAPTQEAVKMQADELYSTLRSAGIQYDPNAFNRTGQFLADKLKREGFREAQAPRTTDILKMIGESAQGNIDFSDLESIRKATSAILREGPAVSNTDKAAASIVLDALDNFATRAPVVTNGKVAPNQVNGLAKQARELARRNIIARDLEEMVTKAETYQSGSVSGIRNQISNYLRSKKGKSLTPQEREAFMDVAKGTKTGNLLNMLGRFGVDPTRLGNNATLIPAAGAGAAYAYTGDPVTAATVAAIGTGAKFGARASAKNAFSRAEKVVLAGRDAQKGAAKAVRARNTATAATTGLSANQARNGNTNWPEGAFMQDANGRFYTKEGRLIPASQ